MISKVLWVSVALLSLLFAGCRYDAPLAEKPTQKIDSRMVGEWSHVDKYTNVEETLQVREWDRSHYVVTINRDAYRAFHTELADLPLLSVQDLNLAGRRYLYVSAVVSTDGRQLTLRVVNAEVIPESIKGRDALQKLVRANFANPALLEAPIVFTRKPPKF